MIDVSPKFNTLRYAKAEGILTADAETIKRVVEKTVPKGDVLRSCTRSRNQCSEKMRLTGWFFVIHCLWIGWASPMISAKTP